MNTERADSRANRRPLVVLLFSVMVVVALIAGLWPFRSSPVNGARLSGASLEFVGLGMAGACSAGPLFPAGEASVTLSAVPRELPLRWTGSLISFYDRAGTEVLGVRQWRDRVVVSSGPAPYAGAPSAFAVGRKTLVTVTAGAGGIRIYTDGRPSGGSEGPFHGLDRAVCFVLGTSPEGRHPWQGSVDWLALWERALAREEMMDTGPASAGLLALYDFKGVGAGARNAVSEELHISVPGVFRPVRRVFLGPLYEDRGRFRLDPGDAAVNVAGFIPIGLLAFFLRPCKRKVFSDLAFAVSAGFALSLAIESIQVFLPGRFSHLTDLVLNTSGAAAGAYLAALLEKMKKVKASID